MDIGKSFTYVFDDEKWLQKVLLGGLMVLLGVIPLVNIFTLLVVAGYSVRTLKNVAEGQKSPLPEWDDWGGDWVKGALTVLASIIYSLPAMLVSGVSAILATIARNAGSDMASMMGICTAGLSCLSALWGILVAVVFPSAMIKYATDGAFGDFFKFGDIFRFIKENLSNYIVAILLMLVANIISAFGVILCIIGVFATSFWSTLVSAHLLGQVKAESMPAAPAAPEMPSYGELTPGDFAPSEDHPTDQA